MITPLDNYNGVKIDLLLGDMKALVIESSRDFGPKGDGRIYALRHLDPGKVVLAMDEGFCGKLSLSEVIVWSNHG